MTKVFPTQYVCTHRIRQAFEKIKGALGVIHEITCEKDKDCIEKKGK